MVNNFKLNIDNFSGVSFQNLPTEVYGWNDCDYMNVKFFLNANKPEILTPEHVNTSVVSKNLWKANLTNIVLENVHRYRQGQELIPLIFITDREIFDDAPNSYLKNLTTPEKIASKQPNYNEKITHAEMRRAYKLCFEMGEDEVSKEIMFIAHQTLHFAQIYKDKETNELQLRNINPFWEREGWEDRWNERIDNNFNRANKIARKGERYWKKQALKAVNLFSQEKKGNEKEIHDFLDQKIQQKKATKITIQNVEDEVQALPTSTSFARQATSINTDSPSFPQRFLSRICNVYEFFLSKLSQPLHSNRSDPVINATSASFSERFLSKICRMHEFILHTIEQSSRDFR